MSKPTYLRSSGAFRQVYSHGSRFSGHLMTIFILPNGLSHHRFGVTASKKAIGNAVQRNRAKRLLREVFRLNEAVFQEVTVPHDWVFNAKRSILDVRLDSVQEDFRQLRARILNQRNHQPQTPES